MPTDSQEDTMMRAKHRINLLRGWPTPTLLPAQMLADQAQKVLGSKHTAPSKQPSWRSLDYNDLSVDEQALLYGPDEGHLPLRKALGSWLAAFYTTASRKVYPDAPDFGIPPERITITGGASQSLAVILRCATDPSYTRNVWCVAPSYFMAFDIFEDAGFAGRLRAVPETSSGPDISFLRKALQQREADWAAERKQNNEPDRPLYKDTARQPKTYKHIIYTVPTFANPSSVTTSLKTREELVRCARDFDALVICDDVYDMLNWPADKNLKPTPESSLKAHIPRVVDVDRYLPGSPTDGFGNVISNGSFSKILAPGVRCGWVEASEKLAFKMSQEGGTKSGGSPSQMTSTLLTGLMESGELSRRTAGTLVPAYHQRYSAMMDVIEEVLLPLGVEVVKGADAETAGGYFVLLILPDALHGRAADVVKRSLEDENLNVGGGQLFEVPGDDSVRFKEHIRLCFAWEAVPELQEGIRRLGRVVDAMLRSSKPDEANASDIVESLRSGQDSGIDLESEGHDDDDSSSAGRRDY